MQQQLCINLASLCCTGQGSRQVLLLHVLTQGIGVVLASALRVQQQCHPCRTCYAVFMRAACLLFLCGSSCLWVMQCPSDHGNLIAVLLYTRSVAASMAWVLAERAVHILIELIFLGQLSRLCLMYCMQTLRGLYLCHCLHMYMHHMVTYTSAGFASLLDDAG